MRSVIAPLFATAAALLLAAGAAKLRSPDATRAALVSIGLPAPSFAVRLLGAGEVALGLICLAWPSRASAGCLAAAYLAFAIVLAQMLRADEPVPCGCFGASSFSASALHAILNLLTAAVCLAAAAAGAPALLSVAQPNASGVVLVLGVAGATYLSFVGFTLLPEMWRSYGSRGEAA